MSWLFYSTSGQIKQGSSALGTDIPIGAILPYARASAPAGWLVCDGSAISRTTYLDLFNEIGTTYGVGNGTTTFNLPDLRGRVPVGKAAAGTFLNMAASGGAETHTLTEAQSAMPTHSHTNSASSGNDNVDHGHSGSTGGISANHQHYPESFDGFCTAPHTGVTDSNTAGQFYAENFAPNGLTSTVTSDHGHAFSTGGRSAFHQHAISVSINNNNVATASQGHNNLQPYQVTQYIIKALNVTSVELDVALDNLSDVATGGVSDGDMLVYRASTSTWSPTPNTVPIGVVLDFYGSTLPDGFLWCDGSAIPGQYTSAIAIIGANTPDLRGRVTAGRDNIGGTDAGRLSISNTLGTTTGAETHALTTGELASHTHGVGTLASASAGFHGHGVSDPGHAHNVDDYATSNNNVDMAAGTNYQANVTILHATHASGTGISIVGDGAHAHTITGASASSGSGTAHNNMQPTMVVNKIIRVE